MIGIIPVVGGIAVLIGFRAVVLLMWRALRGPATSERGVVPRAGSVGRLIRGPGRTWRSPRCVRPSTSDLDARWYPR